MIGDCRTAALIAKSGAIEWLCLPNFSSGSVFASILDRRRGGSFTLCPDQEHTHRRRYVDNTAILETIFTTSGGSVRVTDFMSVDDGDNPWDARIEPQRELIRRIEGLEGVVNMAALIDPRPDYARRKTVLRYRKGIGWVFRCGTTVLIIHTDFEVAPSKDYRSLTARSTIRAGECRTIGLSFSEHDIAIQPAIGEVAHRQEQATRQWWESWSARIRYEGLRKPLVVRSAITLKLLTYALSGAIVAAVTTSLPEAIGAGRNWDYRFCWLRDASITMGALLGLGLQREAGAFLGWVLNSTRLTRPELRILYDLYGRNDDTEAELTHFEGYQRSRPVRIGNGAASQLQLDTYGSVILAAFDYIEREGMLRGGEFKLLRDFGEVVCRRWEEPDHGIWEIRGEPRHFTSTKLMCWAALDRLIRLGERKLVKIPLERFRKNRDLIAAAIEGRGFNEAAKSYVAELDGKPVADASILLMGWVGYGDIQSPRLLSTLNWVRNTLGRDGLFDRYPEGFDGNASREGTFSICSAWATDLMARQGNIEGAQQAFDRLAATANDVGLFSEECDPKSGLSLGNFPQAFTHSGLITAALAITAAQAKALGASE